MTICSLHKSTIDEKTETQPVTPNFEINEETGIPKKVNPKNIFSKNNKKKFLI